MVLIGAHLEHASFYSELNQLSSNKSKHLDRKNSKFARRHWECWAIDGDCNVNKLCEHDQELELVLV